MSGLTLLSLDNNRLDGAFPTSVAGLDGLIILYLQGNTVSREPSEVLLV